MALVNFQELMQTLQSRSEGRSAATHVSKPNMKSVEASHHTSRQTLQEIATVEICPAYPEYMVVGTYALVTKDDDKDYASQIRKGSLLVMPVSSTFTPSYPGQQLPYFETKELSCAILDIHFHPSDPTLLGVATSNAQMHFYRFIKHADVIGRQLQLRLLPLGHATIAPNDEHGLVPLITQFTWLLGTATSGNSKDKLDQQSVALFATTSNQEVILVQVALPAITSVFDTRAELASNPIAASTTNFPSHSLESWCVAASVVRTSQDLSTFLVLSGGDDSALIASLIELGPVGSLTQKDSEPAQHLFTDNKSHTAGVVAILPLKPMKITDDLATNLRCVSPILTGSYDENIRLFIYDPTTMRKKLVTEAPLGGGVWRLKLMDEYVKNPPIESSGAGNATRSHEEKHHFIVLASCMHAGVKILRVSYCPRFREFRTQDSKIQELVGNQGWQIEVLAQFTQGHESMVYCCDFRKEEAELGSYTIVSTSFYDKQVCVWDFVDDVRKSMKGNHEGPDAPRMRRQLNAE